MTMSNQIWSYKAGDRKARAAANAAKRAEYNEEFWARERALEERRQAERAAQAAAAARQEEELRAASCPCPTCNGGTKTLSVKEAAFVMAALSYFRAQGLAPAEKFVSLAHRLAANPTFEVHGDAVVPKGAYNNAPDLGAILAAQTPVPMGEEPDTAADSDESALAQVDKPRRKR